MSFKFCCRNNMLQCFLVETMFSFAAKFYKINNYTITTRSDKICKKQIVVYDYIKITWLDLYQFTNFDFVLWNA